LAVQSSGKKCGTLARDLKWRWISKRLLWPKLVKTATVAASSSACRRKSSGLN
jgi:hypothetical protein